MPVQPGITQVDHGDVPVTVGSARLCHSYYACGAPVAPRCQPGVTSVLQDTNKRGL